MLFCKISSKNVKNVCLTAVKVLNLLSKNKVITRIHNIDFRALKMNCVYRCCFGRELTDWQTKEVSYIKQMKQLQNSISELLQQLTSLQEYHQHEKETWQIERLNLLQKINELQNTLYQKEVVTEQYKVYEDSFRQERQQIQELFATLQKLELKNEAYQEEVKKLNEHIASYRNVIDVLKNGYMKPEGNSSLTVQSEVVDVQPKSNVDISVIS